MCRLLRSHLPPRYTDDDDEREMQTFAYYAAGRTRAEARRLWAQLGGKSVEWEAQHPNEED